MFRFLIIIFSIVLGFGINLNKSKTSSAAHVADSLQPFILKGKIDTVPYSRYFISYWTGEKKNQDTIFLDSASRFELTGFLTEPSLFYMQIENPGNNNYVGDLTMYRFWIEPGKSMVLNDRKGKNQKHITNSRTEYLDSVFEESLLKLESGNPTRETINQQRKDFRKAHSNEYYSLWQLNFLMQNNDQLDHARAELQTIAPHLRNTTLAKKIKKYIDREQMLQIGKILPDFEQSNPEGEQLALKNFRGKYVLLDFWASWCVPCRKEHPNLVKLYQEFAPKGLEIIGISLDEDRKDWLEAIQKDELPWPQMSDLNGMDNAVAQKFGITAVPSTFLLDLDGTILARNVRSSKLRQKLEEILK